MLIHRHVRNALMVLSMLLAAAAPAHAAGSKPAGAARLGHGIYVDGFGASIGRWMKAQAVYWRRVQYADIAHLAGTKQWYRESHLIDAQLYVQDAKVALLVDGDLKDARDELSHAESLVKKGEKGADKAQVSRIKQVASTLDGIKGDLPHSPGQSRKSGRTLAGVFADLRDIVEQGQAG